MLMINIGLAKGWHRRLTLLACAAMVLLCHPAAADPWYEHYANAEQALEDQD